MNVFRKYSSKIIVSISNPLRLVNELWSVKLVSLDAKDYVSNSRGTSDYEKASCVVNDFEKQLSSNNESNIDQLIEFCGIIILEFPSLKSLVEEMKTKLINQ